MPQSTIVLLEDILSISKQHIQGCYLLPFHTILKKDANVSHSQMKQSSPILCEYKVIDGHLVENSQTWFVGRRHFRQNAITSGVE